MLEQTTHAFDDLIGREGRVEGEEGSSRREGGRYFRQVNVASTVQRGLALLRDPGRSTQDGEVGLQGLLDYGRHQNHERRFSVLPRLRVRRKRRGQRPGGPPHPLAALQTSERRDRAPAAQSSTHLTVAMALFPSRPRQQGVLYTLDSACSACATLMNTRRKMSSAMGAVALVA